MIGHDQLTKDLLEAFFGDLLRLVVPEIADHLDLGSVRFLRGQLFTDIPQGEKRRLDLVAEVTARAGPAQAGGPRLLLAHVEPEGQARSLMGKRLWRYGMQLMLRHDKPVLAIAVYRTGGPRGVRKKTVTQVVWGQELASFSYFAFGLSGSEAQEYLKRPEPLAWSLAAQMRPGSWTRARHKLECLRRIVRAPVDDARRFLLANYVETYIELKGEDAEEYEAILAEETNQEVATMELTWADKIEARGVERGMERGMQRMLLLQAEQRFGPLSAAARRCIESIESTDELSRLAERVLVARSWEELGIE